MAMRRAFFFLFAVMSALLTLGPVVTMVLLSFCRSRFPALPWPGWSIIWYRELVADQGLRLSLMRSMAVGGCVSAIAVLFGFGSGAYLSRMHLRESLAFFLGLSLPSFLPAILVAFSFMEFSRWFGVSRSLTGVVAAQSVMFSPIATAIFYQCLRHLNPEMEDAARELGAGEIHILLLTVGYIKGVVASVFIITFVLSWDEYIVSALVSGFDKTYPVQVRTMLEATFSPEVYAIGAIVATSSLALVALALYLASAHQVSAFGDWYEGN